MSNIDFNKTYTSIEGLDFKILKQDEMGFCEIKFIDTGFVFMTSIKNMLNGQVWDDIQRAEVRKNKVKTKRDRFEQLRVKKIANDEKKFIEQQQLQDNAFLSSVSDKTLKGKKKLDESINQMIFVDAQDNNARMIDLDDETINTWHRLAKHEWLRTKSLKNNSGIKGNPDKKLMYHDKALKLWNAMMERTYSSNSNQVITYREKARVHTRWKSFENFLNDLPSIQGFELWKKNKHMHLDKDMLSNYKIYSKDTCIFIPPRLNSALINKDNLEKTRLRILNNTTKQLQVLELINYDVGITWMELISNE